MTQPNKKSNFSKQKSARKHDKNKKSEKLSETLNTKKNKIRLHLRKARQRAIKNLKRDISKYDKEATQNTENNKNQNNRQKLLTLIKASKVENILNLLLAGKENSNSPTNNCNEGENKICKLFLESNEAKLLTDVRKELEEFRNDKSRKTEASDVIVTTDYKTGNERSQKQNLLGDDDHHDKVVLKKDTPKVNLENELNEHMSYTKTQSPKIEDNSEASSDDSFFNSDDDNSESNNLKKAKTPKMKFSKTLTLNYVKNSRFSLDKKRNYQEKRDAFLREKEVEKIENKKLAHTRNHTHLLASEKNLHPSWQAKIASKRKLEAMKQVKSKKITFDSDSE